jgi:hypothetical protein
MTSDNGHLMPEEHQVAPPRVRSDGRPATRDVVGAAAGPLIGLGTLIAAFLALLGRPGPRFASMGLLILASVSVPVFWRTGLSESRKFHIAIAAVLTLALFGTAFYVGIVPIYRSHNTEAVSVANRKLSNLPHLTFMDPPHATVPWCSEFYLNTTSAIPSGYKLAIFATGTAVGSLYTWENVATSVPGQHNQWVTPTIYFGPRYKPNQHLVPESKPVVYAGFSAVVVAELLSDQTADFLAGIRAPMTKDGAVIWGLKELPPSLRTAKEDVTRNSDISGC